MTRTLPWLFNDGKDAKSGKLVTSKAAKRPKDLSDHHPLKSNSARFKGQPGSPKGGRSRDFVMPLEANICTIDRTPSTSPPPTLPPRASPLRPGLQVDDIYIMVEDEFLATAQTFTRHLHHAEYQRLKKTAKERNPSTISKISRPTDGKTPMRNEHKRKKQAQAVDRTLKQGVDELLVKAAKHHSRSKNSDSDFDVNDFEDDHHWQGTQLHAFMSATPRHNLKSLTGLQGVKGHTKAAAGYRRGRLTSERSKPSSVSKVEVLLEDDDETDDLDRPLSPHQRPSAGEAHISTGPSSLHPSRFDFSTRAVPLVTDELATETPASAARSSAAIRARLDARRNRGEMHAGKHGRSNERKSNAEEMPLFL